MKRFSFCGSMSLRQSNVAICPRCSMYGIFNYIYPKNGPNVGKYSSTMEHLGVAILQMPQKIKDVPWKSRFRSWGFSIARFDFLEATQWIGLRENVQESPMTLMGKSMVSCRFSPTNQCIESLSYTISTYDGSIDSLRSVWIHMVKAKDTSSRVQAIHGHQHITSTTWLVSTKSYKSHGYNNGYPNLCDFFCNNHEF